MGDAADELIDEGIASLVLHEAGMCEGICPYCEAEELDAEEGADA